MHRTEGTNNIGNRFNNGPPGTVVEQEWLNSVQEEIAHVIEMAGITLKSAATDTRDQLWLALVPSDAHHGNRGGGALHAVATTIVAGFMSAADKTKLDALYVPSIPTIIPSGTRMLFAQGSAPTSWTKYTGFTSLSGIVYTTGTGGTVSGATDPTSFTAGITVTGSTVLTEAQMPAHSHLAPTDTGQPPDGQPLAEVPTIDQYLPYDYGRAGPTSVTGGGLGHTHSVTSPAITLRHLLVICATKD